MSTTKVNAEEQLNIAREVGITKSTRGWGYIEEYLTLQENSLMRKLVNGKNRSDDEIRGSLKGIQLLKKFLGLTLSTGAEALVALQDFDKEETL